MLSQEFPEELLQVADYVCPNETELSRITEGLPTNTEDEIKAAVTTLQSRGARNVLTTLGADGLILTNKDGELVCIAVRDCAFCTIYKIAAPS